MGWEARRKGVNVLLGPCIGPAGRVVQGGRNWESFSVDPYLSGSLTYETVSGVQGAGVTTTTKVRWAFHACFRCPRSLLLMSSSAYSTSLVTSRRRTACQPARVSTPTRCQSTWTTRRCTNTTFGKSYESSLIRIPSNMDQQAVLRCCTSRHRISHVLIQQTQQFLWLPKQQDPQWSPEGRARIPGKTES